MRRTRKIGKEGYCERETLEANAMSKKPVVNSSYFTISICSASVTFAFETLVC